MIGNDLTALPRLQPFRWRRRELARASIDPVQGDMQLDYGCRDIALPSEGFLTKEEAMNALPVRFLIKDF